MSVCVIGASNVDILSQVYTPSLIMQDSHKGAIRISFGGVARNIAENLCRLGIPSILMSVAAKDILGTVLMEHMKSTALSSLDCSHMLLLNDANTSCYNAFHNEQGEMVYAISDMDIVEEMNIAYFATKRSCITSSSFCVLDTNLSQESLNYIVHDIKGTQYIVDTVSGAKAHKVQPCIDGIFLLKTNVAELASVIKDLHSSYYNDILHFIHSSTDTDCYNEKDVFHAQDSTFFSLLYEIGMLLITRGLGGLVVSMGKNGVWYITKNHNANYGTVEHKHIYLDNTIASALQVKSTTGAGDSLCAGIVYALYNNYSLQESVEYGITVASHTIQSNSAVSSSISESVIQKLRMQIFPKK